MIARIIRPDATMSIGSSNGMASQLSFPSIGSASAARRRSLAYGRRRPAGARQSGRRRGALNDRLEQIGLDAAVGIPSLDGALFGELRIGSTIEAWVAS